jgi:hypothetical protein
MNLAPLVILGAFAAWLFAFEAACTWYWGGRQLWEARPGKKPAPEELPPLEGGTYRTPPSRKET